MQKIHILLCQCKSLNTDRWSGINIVILKNALKKKKEKLLLSSSIGQRNDDDDRGKKRKRKAKKGGFPFEFPADFPAPPLSIIGEFNYAPGPPIPKTVRSLINLINVAVDFRILLHGVSIRPKYLQPTPQRKYKHGRRVPREISSPVARLIDGDFRKAPFRLVIHFEKIIFARLSSSRVWSTTGRFKSAATNWKFHIKILQF